MRPNNFNNQRSLITQTGRQTLALFFSAFFALAGSVSATSYYVDSANGNDAYTGTAGARAGTTTTGPWKTISKVNNFIFQAGDDVYFKCGEKWDVVSASQPRLIVDWSGTASNRSVIGSYYMQNGAPVSGISGARPKFASNMIFDSTKTNKCNGACYDPTNNQYWGMVTVQDRDFVTVENIRVENVYGQGIYVVKGAEVIIQNCETFFTWDNGILVNGADQNFSSQGSPNVKILNNAVEEFAYRPYFLGPVPLPTGVGIAHSVNGALIKGNKVFNSWGGESISAYFNCDNVTVEDNEVYGVARIGVYFSGNITNSVIRRNLIYGTNTLRRNTSEKFQDWKSENGSWFMYPGYGIAIEDEYAQKEIYRCGVAPWDADRGDVRCHTANIGIYNNTLAYLSNDFWLSVPDEWTDYWNGSAWTLGGNSTMDNISIYNNTAVGNRFGSFKIIMGSDGQSYVNVNIKNNLIACGGESPCLNYSGPSNTGIRWSNNIWPFSTASNHAGAGDVVNNSPALAKTTGWRSLYSGSLSGVNFKLQSTSPAINKGTALGAPYNLDYFGTTRPQGSAWDIGAHEYVTGSSDTTAPASPSGLSVR